MLLLEIAGITISLRSAVPLTLRALPPCYEQFVLGSGHCMTDSVIGINLELGPFPDTEHAKMIFDTEQSWSLLFDGKDYFVILRSAVLREPLWMVRFDRSCRDITIFCGEPSLTREDNRILALNPLSYPLDQILLMYILSQKQGALVHAAGMTLHGKGYIFPGRSGAGKSTMARLLYGRPESVMLSDDRIILRRHGSAVRAYGTPWPGDAGIAENRSARLDGIIFIRHGSSNRMKKLTPQEAWKMLMPVTSIPWYDEKTLSVVLQFCEELVSAIPAYELSFLPVSSAADFLADFLAARKGQ